MNRVTSIVIRRIRIPLIVLITAYAVSIVGMMLAPGIDDNGQRWHMGFFDAFYFVSFMATTIGFGEIPFPFSAAQRLWASIAMYLGVVAWLYAIGTIFTIVRDKALARVFVEARFTRDVERLRERFYLLCGYGDTGIILLNALAQRDLRAVVLDQDPDAIANLSVQEYPFHVPGLCADAGFPDYLKMAGLQDPCCAGVVALTNSDATNLKIAITAKLLNPKVKVICRAETHDVMANMASFDTDHMINPFDIFADHLAMALHAPSVYLLNDWLTGVPDTLLSEPLYPPRGLWVLCGYGRFGQAINKRLQFEGITTTMVDANEELIKDERGSILGRGTEAVTLREAKIEEAAGVVAGTDSDSNNLSIIMTARALNPELFAVVRQNKRANDAIFDAVEANLVMQPSQIIARKILALITTPLLGEFLRLARQQKDDWANQAVSRLSAVVGDVVPDLWTAEISSRGAHAVAIALGAGQDVRLRHVGCDPQQHGQALECVALLLQRGSELILLPDEDQPLQDGDKILFCGTSAVEDRMQSTLHSESTLAHMIHGAEAAESARRA